MTNILNSEQFNDFINAAHEHNKKLAAERKSKRHKRDVPMPILDYGEHVCPKCNCIQEPYCTEYDDKDHYPKYCYNCGQRLDWTKIKEKIRKERGKQA